MCVCRCVAICSLGLWVCEELGQQKIHQQVIDAINVLGVTLKVSVFSAVQTPLTWCFPAGVLKLFAATDPINHKQMRAPPTLRKSFLKYIALLLISFVVPFLCVYTCMPVCLHMISGMPGEDNRPLCCSSFFFLYLRATKSAGTWCNHV